MAGTRPRFVRMGWWPFMPQQVAIGARGCLPAAAGERGSCLGGYGRLTAGG